MLAAWLRREEIKEAEQKGRDDATNEMLEADRQRRPDETLAEAVERLRREKEQTR